MDIFEDLSAAFAAFSQLQVGEAFYEVLYASIVWKKAWIHVTYFLVFHFWMAFLFGDLFFGLLLEFSQDFYNDDDDDESPHISSQHTPKLSILSINTLHFITDVFGAYQQFQESFRSTNQ